MSFAVHNRHLALFVMANLLQGQTYAARLQQWGAWPGDRGSDSACAATVDEVFRANEVAGSLRDEKGH